MKINLDKKYFKYSLYAFISVAMSILFFKLLDNLGLYFKSFNNAFIFARRILSPFIIGAFVAYLLNPGVRWFEKNLYNQVGFIKKKPKLHRFLSVISVYLILVGLTTTMIFFVAPQIGHNISEIIKSIPEYITLTNDLISNLVEDFENYSTINISQQVNTTINRVFTTLSDLLENSLDNLVVSILSISSGLLNFVLGIIASFYILMDKESFKTGFEKIMLIIFKGETVDGFKSFFREADELFAKFIVGKSIDSFIIGIMCFIGLRIMGLRYALLISSVVAITNMIPYFGPFIGAVPGVIITFFDDPIKAIWLILFILALQQFDGLILGPKILGDSVGVSPFWIIFSIVVGGKLFGVLGMFLGVPVIGVVRLVVNRFIEAQLERKNITLEKSKAG